MSPEPPACASRRVGRRRRGAERHLACAWSDSPRLWPCACLRRGTAIACEPSAHLRRPSGSRATAIVTPLSTDLKPRSAHRLRGQVPAHQALCGCPSRQSPGSLWYVVYNLGFALYTFFSLLLTVTWMHGSAGATWLVVMRIFQGVGAAFLLANSAAILTDAFPAEQRGMALGINQAAGIAGMFIGHSPR